jgi:hypothetical protein
MNRPLSEVVGLEAYSHTRTSQENNYPRTLRTFALRRYHRAGGARYAFTCDEAGRSETTPESELCHASHDAER